MLKLCVSSVLVLYMFILLVTQPLSGRAVYEKKCSRCHGPDGTKHFLGAKDLQKSEMDDIAIIQIIMEGKSVMPSYKKKLTEDEIKQVVEYVKGLRK
jgi:cytochrome c6